MEWIKGRLIGTGSFSAVRLGVTMAGDHQYRIMAVKSASALLSSSLRREKEILDRLRDCPHVVSCYGDDATPGGEEYNLFLEFVPGGNLADHLKRSGGRLPEINVRHITRSILRGLCSIHAGGYVHCDIKPQNILVCSSTDVKIADFGLAKRAGAKVSGLRGTPLYMAPESVARCEYEAPADVWSLGCTVLEMMTGRPAWKYSGASDVAGLLLHIGFRDESPEIPSELPEEARDFLVRCFVRDPTIRWTAEMLAAHPYVTVAAETSPALAKKAFESPRSAFDFPEWISQASDSILPADPFLQREINEPPECGLCPADRIRQLATELQQPNWSSCSFDPWISVRRADHPIPSSSASSVEAADSDDSALEKMGREEPVTRYGLGSPTMASISAVDAETIEHLKISSRCSHQFHSYNSPAPSSQNHQNSCSIAISLSPHICKIK